MNTEELKVIATTFFDDVWNRHDVNAIDRLFAPDFIDHYLSIPRAPDRDGFKHECSFYLTALPDTTLRIDDQIAERDRVASRVVFRGTHTGPFGPLPPTGRTVEVTGCIVLRIADGLIVERWGNIDDLGALRQLGLVPAMPGEPTLLDQQT
ncbi:MAG: ester cyclase [Candidatus Methylomirabilaceae bacterium]